MPYKDKAKKKANAKKHYEKNKERISFEKKEYYKNNRDKILAWKEVYRNKNRTKVRESDKKHYDRNKKKIYCRKKMYKLNHRKNVCEGCGKLSFSRYCTKECFYNHNKGENHCAWTGGPNPYPPVWNIEFRKLIRDRDNNICMRCRKPREVLSRALAVHHVDGIPKNTFEENCISLCNSCHAIVEKSGKKIEIFKPLFEKMLSKLYGYKYE